jgi:hypothetical protein
MRIITSNLIGPSNINYGLGNQLFQIAAAMSYAKDYGFVDTFPVLRNPTHGGYYKNFLRNVNSECLEEPEWHLYQEPSFSYSPIPEVSSSIYLIDSYLQSEKYFCHNRDLILDAFKPSEGDLSYLNKKYAMDGSITSMHLRRGDYLHSNCVNHHTNLMATDYYTRAIKDIRPDRVLVFSDEPSWAKDTFPEYQIVEEEDYMEIYLMSLCENNIIANSSFSWWGAWLNQNPDKKVVAPSNWFGRSYDLATKDLIPDSWKLI